MVFCILLLTLYSNTLTPVTILDASGRKPPKGEEFRGFSPQELKKKKEMCHQDFQYHSKVASIMKGGSFRVLFGLQTMKLFHGPETRTFAPHVNRKVVVVD